MVCSEDFQTLLPILSSFFLRPFVSKFIYFERESECVQGEGGAEKVLLFFFLRLFFREVLVS